MGVAAGESGHDVVVEHSSALRFQKAAHGKSKKLGRLGGQAERKASTKAETRATLEQELKTGEFNLPMDRVQTASMRGMLERAMKSVNWEPEPLEPEPAPFSVLAPYTEPYEDGEYTLSGSVFHSYAEEHCHHLYLEIGKCPAPCARYVGDMLDLTMFPGNEGLSKDELDKVEEKLGKKWDKDATKKYEEQFAAYRERQLDGATREDAMLPPAPRDVTALDCLAKKSRFDAAEEDQCLCIDPCRRFKTCEECNANKASHMTAPDGVPAELFKPPHWAAIGSPYNCGWCQNKCVSGGKEGPNIGGDECVWWRYTVPSCQKMEVRELPPPPPPQCDNKRYSECDPPCRWIGNTRFTGHCTYVPGEGKAEAGADAGAAGETADEEGQTGPVVGEEGEPAVRR